MDRWLPTTPNPSTKLRGLPRPMLIRLASELQNSAAAYFGTWQTFGRLRLGLMQVIKPACHSLADLVDV
jgi:hypothetical protein